MDFTKGPAFDRDSRAEEDADWRRRPAPLAFAAAAMPREAAWGYVPSDPVEDWSRGSQWRGRLEGGPPSSATAR